MNIGVIGTGLIVKSVLEAAKPIEGITWGAVYSRKYETGESFAKQFGIPRIDTDLDSFLSGSEIDTVYIASPNSLHYVQARAALEHGKNVIVEKPFTSTLKEAQELQKLAKEKNLFLFEAITTRYLPNYDYIRNQLPKLGRLRMVQCCFSQYSSRYDALLRGEVSNVFNPAFSGGALEDINLYNIQFVMGLFGAPIEAKYYPNRHTNGIDTSGVAVLQYPDFICTCQGAKDTVSLNCVQIQGENGFILVNDKSNECRAVRMILRDGSETSYDIQNEPRWCYELRAMRDMIASKNYAECRKQLDVTLQVVACMEAMRRDADISFAADLPDR